MLCIGERMGGLGWSLKIFFWMNHFWDLKKWIFGKLTTLIMCTPPKDHFSHKKWKGSRCIMSESRNIQVETMLSIKNYSGPQCLKIAKKVAFNIASEASYVYILSGQKFIRNTKNGEVCCQTVLPDRSL